MTKKQLRELYKQKRAGLTEKERLKMDDLLLIQFQQYVLDDIITVLSYWPIQQHGEVNTHLITDFMAFRIPGMQLAYTVMDMQTRMMHPVIVNDDTSYQINQYNIAEPIDGHPIDPKEIDLVIVPLLVCDERGYRVGYGKGFYDRFLPNCREDVIKIGFNYFDPIPTITDINEFDVPLNVCITPNNRYEF